MDKETHWYRETDGLVIADGITTGKPMVVVKSHIEDIFDLVLHADVKPVVEEIFGEHELEVRMNHVGNHWHAHIRDTDVSFSEARDEHVVRP
jgi:hypothetical protein